MAHASVGWNQAGASTRWSTNDIARLGLLLALATTLHIFEAQLPALPIPGAKIGLANIVSLIALYVWGVREALLLTVLRQLVGSLVTGTLFSPVFAFGLAGSVLSVLVMALALLVGGRILGPVAVSLLGATAHNVGQLFVAWALLGQPQVFYYLPYLLWFAVPSGALVGVTVLRMLPVALGDLSATPAKGVQRTLAWGTATALVLAGVWLTVSLGSSGVVGANPEARIAVAGSLHVALPLDRGDRYELHVPEGRMVIETEDGRVRVAESTCRHQICVRTGWIERTNQSIVCLPFQVVVTVAGGTPQEFEYDALVY